MDETHVMLVLIGFATGLMIAVAALVAMGARNSPPVVVVSPPPPANNDMGCGGFLILITLMIMGLFFWLIVLA